MAWILNKTTGTAAVLGLALLLGGVVTHASDPVGVYGLIERITVTPSSDGSATAQVWGAFVVAVRPQTSSYKPEEAYGKASKGYLLFTCPSFKGSSCSAELNDLKTLAGTGQVAGFGARYGTLPRVRPSAEAPKAPDPYELNMGVVRLGKYGDYPSIVAALKTAPPQK